MGIKMLRKLTKTFGVSGREGGINKVILDMVSDFSDKITTDGIDNLIVYKEGNGKNKKKIMVSAHKDEIGFMVMAIDDDGYLTVRGVGGIDVMASYSNKIIFRNGTIGILGLKKGPADKKQSVTDMYVDIGATSKKDAEKKVKAGDVAGYLGDLVKLRNGRVASKAMDDRVGCYIAIQALMKLKGQYNDMYFVFSSQEEVGLRGATVASRGIKPDIGIAVDITGSYDTPAGKNGNMKMGDGAAIKVMDRSVICDETVVDTMVGICKEKNIKYQMDILPSGGTDAGAMNISNDGVRAGGISIPSRNGHSPVCVVDMKDVKACIELLAEFADSEIEI